MLSNNDLMGGVPTPQRSAFAELLLLVALIIGGALVTGVISSGIGKLFPGYATAPAMFRFTQFYSTIISIGLPVLVWRRVHQESLMLYFDASRFSGRDLLFAFIFVLIIQPVVWLLVYLNSLLPLPEWATSIEQKAEILIQELLCTDQWYTLLANIVVIAIVPAVCEEMLFRGLLQSFFSRRGMNAHLAVWLVAIIFGVVHFQFAGIFARIFLGAVLGYLFHYSRTLWLPIVVHALNNAGSVILYFVQYNLTGSTDSTDPEFNLIILSAALLGLVGFVYLLRRFYVDKTTEQDCID